MSNSSALSVARISAFRRMSGWAIWQFPRTLRLYLLVVEAAAVVVFVHYAMHTSIALHDVALAVTLLGCAVLTLEALRRSGEPTGLMNDMEAAWALPMAFLLPPLYVLLAPIPLTIAQQLLIRRTEPYRRIFSAAAIGLSYVSAAVLFHQLAHAPLSWSMLAAHPASTVGIMLLGGAVYSVVNTLLVVIAMRLRSPEMTLREFLFDRETRKLELVETTSGVIVSILAALSAAIVPVALPPFLLLQRSLLHEQLRSEARTDAKTGLLNAAAWNREAERQIGQATRTEKPLAVLLLDIDHFKQVNDTYGHLVGDQMLRVIATAIQEEVRTYDVAGRFGGEEFVLFLTDADSARAHIVAERLRDRIAALIVAPAGVEPVRVTVSIGVSMFDTDGTDLTELLAERGRRALPREGCRPRPHLLRQRADLTQGSAPSEGSGRAQGSGSDRRWSDEEGPCRTPMG